MLTHDFLLLPEKDGNYAEQMDHFHDPKAIKLDDGFVQYIMDTLRWIPTINPANSPERGGHGLNYHGLTVINKTGAGKAARIFRLWAALMQEGPERIELKGSFEWTEGEPSSEGGYATIEARRDSVVNSFQGIADFAEQAASGEFFVLHLGI